MTDTHRDTVMRLGVEVGTGCAKLMTERMRELHCKRVQVDEIWSYVGKKQRQVTPQDDGARVGDQWTFVALDPETKIVPAFRIGKRDLRTATAFMTDLSERLSNRVQISSDALAAYEDATERAFGADVDYGQVVKFYEAAQNYNARNAGRRPLEGFRPFLRKRSEERQRDAASGNISTPEALEILEIEAGATEHEIRAA